MVPAKLPPSCTRRWGCGPVPVVPRSCRCRAQRSRYRAGASGRRTRPVSLSASLTADPTDTPAVNERRDAKHRGCPRGGNHSDDLRDHVPDVGCDINVERWTGKWHQTIREGGSGYVEVAGSRGYRDDLVPVGYRVTDTVRSCAGTTAGGCGGAACRSYTAAWRQQVRRPTWRRSCDLLDPHGERSCAGPSGPDSARPSQWAVAGHVTSVGVGGLDPHGCGR